MVMCLKTLTAIAIFSITTFATFAQDGPRNQNIQADTGGRATPRGGDHWRQVRDPAPDCELGAIHDQLRQALDSQDAKAIDAFMSAKVDASEQQLGTENDKVIEGLELIDVSFRRRTRVADVFNALQEKCE